MDSSPQIAQRSKPLGVEWLILQCRGKWAQNLELPLCSRYVREKTRTEVDMRVGVHTGTVLGGVLGQKRWQFDVWSTDVSVANKMESGGIPGYESKTLFHGDQSNYSMHVLYFKRVSGLSRRVHISETTKDSLHGEFELEPGNGGERCEYLLERGISTYLVLAPKHLANGLSGNVSDVGHSSFSIPTFFKSLEQMVLLLPLPQRLEMLSNRSSNKLINTTASRSNMVSPQSTPTECKQEVS